MNCTGYELKEKIKDLEEEIAASLHGLNWRIAPAIVSNQSFDSFSLDRTRKEKAIVEIKKNVASLEEKEAAVILLKQIQRIYNKAQGIDVLIDTCSIFQSRLNRLKLHQFETADKSAVDTNDSNVEFYSLHMKNKSSSDNIPSPRLLEEETLSIDENIKHLEKVIRKAKNEIGALNNVRLNIE